MKHIKVLSLVAIMTFSFMLFRAPVASAQFSNATDEACAGLAIDDGSFINCDEENNTKVDSLLKTLLNLLSIIAGFIAVLMIILAGIKFITSEGDASKVSSAKNSIIYAIVGVIIVVISQALILMVINRSSDAIRPSGPPRVGSPRNPSD